MAVRKRTRVELFEQIRRAHRLEPEVSIRELGRRFGTHRRTMRVQGDGKNHRLFCLLERHADDLGGPSIILIDGLSKPRRSAANPKDYRRAAGMRAEFVGRRTIAD